jgi:hypothetical protein
VTGRRGGWLRVAALLGSSVACYVATNLLVANFVTMAHAVAITFEVRDDTSSAPIGGAVVAWHWREPGAPEMLGATDPSGALRLERTIQQIPLWAFPTLGTLDLTGRVLSVDAPGYAPWRGDLGPLVAPPLGDARGTVRVRLRRA